MMKEEHHIFKGMRRDNHLIKQDPSFLWDALNIRITSRDDNTLLSITNEKGQEDIGPSFSGSYLGHCVIGKFIILFIQYGMNFGTYNGLKIIRLTNTNQYPDPTGGDFKWKFDTLFDGVNEDSTINNPISQIEAIGYYESELVLKVYWIDGKSQPKVINIALPELLFTGIPGLINNTYDSGLLYMGINYSHPNPTSSSSAEKKLAELYPNGIWPKGYKTFDFVLTLNLREDVSVTKTYESGSFSPGTIQYAFTYYNKYGAESKIFYTTGLYYISHKDRGGSPEETISNGFKINISSCDDFEYVRIYSIHRTSIDAVPTVKLVSDVKVVNGNIQYTDNGTSGHVVDNSLLLYIGGVSIIPTSMAAKDGTLFFGNILLDSQSNFSTIKGLIEGVKNNIIPHTESLKEYTPDLQSGEYYSYTPRGISDLYAGGFKYGERYRCGIQVQTEDGEWSAPIHLDDVILNESFPGKADSVNINTKSWTLPSSLVDSLISNGVKRIRPCVVFPSPFEYDILCQGVLNPTVYNVNCRKGNAPYVQSSWFFRPPVVGINNNVFVDTGAWIEYTHNKALLSGGDRGAEIQNMYSPQSRDISEIANKSNPETYRSCFFVDSNIVTMHSPDIEFNDSIQLANWEDTKLVILGAAPITSARGDIDIQTSSPPYLSSAAGFVKHSIGYDKFGKRGDRLGTALISGLFYEDGKVRENPNDGAVPYKFLVYPWHRSGSLNNDSTRPSDGEHGTRTAVLSKKKISNLRFSDRSIQFQLEDPDYNISTPQLFNSNEVSLLNVRVPYLNKEVTYYGNVDYLNTTREAYGIFGADPDKENITAITNIGVGETPENRFMLDSRDPVRIKYKSTPHLVFSLDNSDSNKISVLPMMKHMGEEPAQKYKVPMWLLDDPDDYPTSKEFTIEQQRFGTEKDMLASYLLIGEIRRKNPIPDNVKFGGNTPEALRENLWLPASEPVRLTNEEAKIIFEWGDTWYSRYDCLKTYPFTQEDENSIVEIFSFMCETRTNIDGRYDKNRGQLSNLYMTPLNFNKINNVYSQKDNFFNYRILDDIYYRNNRYPNQITWSLEKTSSSDTDPWTHITLANTLDMDGTKGEITSLNTWNEYLLCFLEEALSNVMFNSRALIPVSDGVPIEIANGYRVDGSRLLGNIGCTYKKSIATTPAGLYFKDTKNTGSIWLFNGQLTNLSQSKGMDLWAKKHKKLNTFYDKEYRDVYFIVPYGGRDDALCYSEVLGEFTSFFSYGPSLGMLNFDNRFMSIMAQPRSYPWGLDYVRLCENNSGSYNYFYDNNYNISSTPWHISFISNQDPSATKIFDTVELRSEYYANGGGSEVGYCPVNEISVENEYQSSQAIGPNMNSRHKFRIWRINIPRSTKVASSNGTDTTRPTYGRSRIRNPWTMIKLGYNEAITGDTVTPNGKAVIHDVTVKYTV